MATIRASQATYTRSDHASTIYYPSAKATLQVQTAARHAFVYFPLPRDLAGKTVTSAVVKMTAASSVPAPTYTLVRHADLGIYSKMTWNGQHSRPNAGAMTGATNVTGTKTGAVWSFDVSADVAAVAAGGDYYGFRLTTSDATVRQFVGPQSSADYPVLELTYSAVPAAPSDVAPSGGVTSVPKPWVTWQAADDVDLVQVQLDTVGSTWDEVTGFASPVFDSGSVTSTVGQINLAATAYAGLADGAYVDMSIRQHGALGWSEWSLPVTWGYAARPAVVLTNPGATSGDPTPPHAWTVTPAGQLSWQLQVTQPGALRTADRAIYDSKRVAGADNSATPTAGPTNSVLPLHSVLRIVDRSDRIATLGQPVYTEATQDWLYDPDLAMLPADSVSVSQVGKTPQIEVTILRDDAPDEWLVQVGEADPIRFDFDEYAVGPMWVVASWECPPNTPTDVVVTPFVGGGAGTPYTVSVTTEVSGTWLTDPVTGLAFSASNEAPTEAAGSSVATFTPIGGTRPIIRTQALRGLEGSVEGELFDSATWGYDDGPTTAELAATFDEMRLLSVTREFRQISGTRNMAVVVTGMSLSDHPESMLFGDGVTQDVRRVRWDYYQTDFDDGGLFSGELG